MIRKFYDDSHCGNGTFFCGCQFTADEGRRGGAAAEGLSPKAKWYYLNTDPMFVYEYVEEDATQPPDEDGFYPETTRYAFYDGGGKVGLTFEELNLIFCQIVNEMIDDAVYGPDDDELRGHNEDIRSLSEAME